MHPAFSVIVFTVLSGAGYGLLFLLGIGAAVGVLPAERGFGAAAFALSLGAVIGGLVSSTFHLGHPERAWRALSQWRTSWLSREGLASLITFIPATAFAMGWILLGENGGGWGLFGLVAAIWAAITVYCTAMIYASLAPVQRWHNGWVAPCYLLLGLMAGATWLNALVFSFGLAVPGIEHGTLLALMAGWLVKLGYWRHIDRTRSASTAGSATGLGHLGKVRLLDAPHTEENFLLREMGFRIARKHAYKLRAIATVLAFVLPSLLVSAVAVLSALPAQSPGLTAALQAACSILAALVIMSGLLVERWLFFAEAKHTVTLYYGADSA
jgi:DMSO reductase anchor subunit